MNRCVYSFLISILLPCYSFAWNTVDSTMNSKSDSEKVINSRQLYIAANFQQLINFKNNNNLNFDISTRYNQNRNKTGPLHKTRQELNFELSFTKYVDSIIEIRDDAIEMKSNWEFHSLKVVNALNLELRSQFTNSYEYTFTKNELIKALSKETLFPAVICLGTGFNFKLKKDNLINFSPVDIKTTFLTEKLILFYPAHNRLSERFFYQTEIGASLTVTIYKIWAKDQLSWRNNSRIFIKDLTRAGATFYSKNRIMYELYKWINLSFENQLLYDPIYNYKLQLKNEMVLGVSFRK
ncbi:MAG: hypothetical protein ACO1G9_05905 [Bacteroidota bacterium]